MEQTIVTEGAVTLTVGEATVRMGIERTRLRLEGQKDVATESDFGVGVLRVFTYPDLLSATVRADGMPWPLTFEQFLELPEKLVVKWEKAAYALNAHWLPPEEPSSPKGLTTPTNSTQG